MLRPYQIQAIDNLRAALGKLPVGRRRVVCVAPTGAGKTTIASEIVTRAVKRASNVLWVAHRTELIEQAAATLKRSGVSTGCIAASSVLAPNPYLRCQVASIQTLAAREQRPPADLLILDESHHAVSEQYLELLKAYPNATVIGLTATPERGDGKGLGEVFNGIVSVATIKQLTEGGYLVPCEVIAPAGQLRPGQIAQRPADAYLAHAQGRSALVFSPTIKAAQEHVDEFTAAGVRAVLVEGTTPGNERRAALRDFAAGRLPVVVNCAVLTEGTDLPIASCAILARPCGTEGLFLQIVGRILRTAPGKTSALLIDLRGITHVHGAPDEDRHYSLDGRGITHGANVAQSYCKVCGAPMVPGKGCEECGTGPADERPLVVTNDPLVKYAAARRKPDEHKRAKVAAAIKQAMEAGKTPWGAFFRYKEAYGIDKAFFISVLRSVKNA